MSYRLFAFLSLLISNGLICAEAFNHRKLFNEQLSDETRSGRYIVFLDDKVEDVNSKLLILLGTLGGALLHTYSRIYKGACIGDVSMDLLQHILDDDQVLFVEEDHETELFNSQNGIPWNLDRLDQPLNDLDGAFNYQFGGEGITAFVLDSGIDSSHSEFGGRVVCGFNAVKGEDCNDGNGHGTAVASVLGGRSFGVAKNVTLETVKIHNQRGRGWASWLIAGINYVAERKLDFPQEPMVASLSVGASWRGNAVKKAVHAAVAAGVVVVVAAGNRKKDACSVSPASSEVAITVGATTSFDFRQSSSNFGSCVDLFAPGESIPTASTNKDSSNTWSGTSFAAPHVAGVAAMYLQANPSWSPEDVKEAILTNGVKNRLYDIEAGSPNLLVRVPILNTQSPSESPQNQLSLPPSAVPSRSPQKQFSLAPSATPSMSPHMEESLRPSAAPSDAPEKQTSITPTTAMSGFPSLPLSESPSSMASLIPSLIPSTSAPTILQTEAPSRSLLSSPSKAPAQEPSTQPSVQSSMTPTWSPTPMPTVDPFGEAVNSAMPSYSKAQLPLFLNCGNESEVVLGSDGQPWQPDQYYLNGKTFYLPRNYAGTPDNELFHTERWGGGGEEDPVTYDIPVPNGIYVVDLMFAEMFHNMNNSRIMNVYLEGSLVLESLDIFELAGGRYRAVTKTFTVEVFDESLLIEVKGIVDNGKINSISVTRGEESTLAPSSSSSARPSLAPSKAMAELPLLMNCGNATNDFIAVSDTRIWTPDQYYQGGDVFFLSRAYAMTKDDKLYETERWGSTVLYEIPVPSGAYIVELHFAEMYFRNIGERVFSIFVENSVVLADYDIVERTGSRGRAIVEVLIAVVSDQLLSISLVGSVENAKVNAVGVTSYEGVVTTMVPTTVPTTVPTMVPTTVPTMPPSFGGGVGITPSLFPSPSPSQSQAPSAGFMEMVQINCGELAASYTAVDGSVWEIDQYYDSGTVGFKTRDYDNTDDDTIFSTDRLQLDDGTPLTYDIPVGTGVYTVELLFTESANRNDVGRRVFDVAIEGDLVLDDFDLWMQHRGKFVAIAEAFKVTVRDGSLTISLTASVDTAKINAIGVYREGPISEEPSQAPSSSAGPSSVVSMSPSVLASLQPSNILSANPTSSQLPTFSPAPSALPSSSAAPTLSLVPSSSPTDSPQWLTVATVNPVPNPRHEACFVMVNDKGYLIGGRGVHPVDVYDPTTRTWDSKSGPGFEINHMQCVAADDKVWIMSSWTGGYPREKNVPDVWVYDTINDVWETRTALPFDRQRGGAAAVVRGREIYLSHGNRGGHGSHSTSLGWLDKYNIDTDTWTTNLPDAPNPRDHTGGALVGNKLCVGAGRNSGVTDFFNNVVLPTDCYNFETEEWEVHQDIPQGRGGSSYGQTCDGKLIVAGGEAFGQAWDNVDVFDGISWQALGNLNAARHGTGIGVSCTCDQIHFPSGSGDQGGTPELDTVETYFPQGVDAACSGA